MTKALKKDQKKGIFCLETCGWYGPKDKTTFKPILEMLQNLSGLKVPYLYATVATEEELTFHLERYIQPKFDSHPILYFAAHGTDKSRHSICLEGGNIDLEYLSKLLKQQCENRIVYFGSCSVMNIHGSHLNKFCKKPAPRQCAGT